MEPEPVAEPSPAPASERPVRAYHSLRHMAASSMKAIGVSDQRVKMMGRWKCIETVDDTYVDPACADTYGCYRLYGHLLPSLNRLEHLARRPEDLRRW